MGKRLKYKLWNETEIKFLQDNFKSLTNLELANKIKKTEGSIIAKLHKLHFRRTKEDISKILTRKFNINNISQPKKPWSNEEMQILSKNYSFMNNRDISKLLNRNMDSLEIKAFRIGLKKSKTFIKKNGLKARKCNLVLPNKPETSVFNIIKQNNLPFNYVGDGKIWFRGEHHSFNPDFLSKNPKHIIEVFGDYWHNRSDLIRKIDKERIATYSRYGYKTLILWDWELTNKKDIINKIRGFVENAKA